MEILYFEDLGDTRLSVVSECSLGVTRLSVVSECSLGVNLVIDNFLCSFRYFSSV